jgi:hypothetical protein
MAEHMLRAIHCTNQPLLRPNCAWHACFMWPMLCQESKKKLHFFC